MIADEGKVGDGGRSEEAGVDKGAERASGRGRPRRDDREIAAASAARPEVRRRVWALRRVDAGSGSGEEPRRQGATGARLRILV